MQATHKGASRRPPPRDALVLAAVDRAYRHRASVQPGVSLTEIADHLGLSPGPAASRRLHPTVDRLTYELGWLHTSRRWSRDCWALTDRGHEELSRALVAGIADELPESPQHREWRAARQHAAVRLEELRTELGELMAKLNGLIDAQPPASAAELVALAEPLHDHTTALAMAHYCLHERAQPDDAHADHEDKPAVSVLAGWRHPGSWDPSLRHRPNRNEADRDHGE